VMLIPSTVKAWNDLPLPTRNLESLNSFKSLINTKNTKVPAHYYVGCRNTLVIISSIFCFVDCCLSFSTFSFGHCVVCSSSIYGFWLPLWYLQSSLQIIKWQYKTYHTVCTVLQLKLRCSVRVNSSCSTSGTRSVKKSLKIPKG
jgi:hypothetical protein